MNGKINDLLFLYQGKDISLMDSQLITSICKYKKTIIISVYNININNNIDNISGNIICPDCKNLTFLNLNGDNIKKLIIVKISMKMRVQMNLHQYLIL